MASYEEAYKEAVTLARPDTKILDTFQFTHPSLVTSVSLVNDFQDRVCTLETGEQVTFTRCGFRFKPPASGQQGVQTMDIALDNVGMPVENFINSVKDKRESVRKEGSPFFMQIVATGNVSQPCFLMSHSRIDCPALTSNFRDSFTML